MSNQSTASAPSDRLAQIKGHIALDKPTMAGKVCIITGASSLYGIGRASALAMAKQSPTAIYVTDLSTDNLEELAETVQKKFPSVKCYARKIDAASDEDVRSIINEAMTTFGRLDVFFANAGVASGTHIKDETAESFMRMMKINALSVFLAIKHAGQAMQVTGKGGKEHSGGSIIGTASVAGIRSGAGSSEYSASKAAVINLAQTAAYQYGRTNVRVNAICPGLIETGMTKQTFDYARSRGNEHKIGQLNPLARYGIAGEIASVVAFLASDDASYVNGQAWAVDGGLSSSHPIVPGKFH
ncbi:hypothetical protein INT44_002092 [Umbelopsis vinacea]|uniref:NAD(P)-binding protein n=1 Tax=Umbelopsis vinacea TaxID=44442 RepID=A0A8H7UKP9_9FUNG|nr:hypothetical protein INT44_002092 [Umbelopsis vinacea]KAI9284841.1 hypothetical protein BC943DRAFT_360790 [Umbelopsis sp. AD052]